jgi:hypothetical protein
MPKKTEKLTSINAEDLWRVTGGASRVTSRSSGSTEQLTTMLTQITSSIKDLANKNNSSDSMLPMMMMMMMGGGGGGGAAAAPAAPPPPPPPPPRPVVSITNSISR